MEKAEQVKTASIISAEGDTEAADLLASAFAKAGEGLVSNIPTYIVQGAGAALKAEGLSPFILSDPTLAQKIVIGKIKKVNNIDAGRRIFVVSSLKC